MCLAACLLTLSGWPLARGSEHSRASSGIDADASPIFGVTIPVGYRQWEMIAPSQETSHLDELRVILGKD